MYKTEEDYYKEILELKKSLKLMHGNEVINNTKLKYFEHELVKKEKEIMHLLDFQKEEGIKSFPDSKSDLEAVGIYIYIRLIS